MQAFDVFLKNKKVDTVYYDKNTSTDFIRRILIEQEGYDHNIRVRKSREEEPEEDY